MVHYRDDRITRIGNRCGLLPSNGLRRRYGEEHSARIPTLLRQRLADVLPRGVFSKRSNLQGLFRQARVATPLTVS
jgi:hypothetical protein